MRTYNLDTFNDILSNNHKITLPDDVLSIYDNLIKQLNINTQVTNDGEYRERRINKRTKYNKKQDLLSSGKVVEFKERTNDEKVGSDKIMTDIRGIFNKLSSKNYDTQRDLLISYMNELSESYDESYLITCSNYFFDVASKNRFYSEMYAKLYKELTQLYHIFEERKDQFLSECIDNLETITYVDETSDYEGFCKNNKQNDIRRSMNLFLINLYKNEECSLLYILKMIDLIQEKITQNRDNSNEVHTIEELTENLFLFYSELTNDLKKHSTWGKNIAFITDYSTCKTKDHPGLSTRIKFKYMDMMDAIKKN